MLCQAADRDANAATVLLVKLAEKSKPCDKIVIKKQEQVSNQVGVKVCGRHVFTHFTKGLMLYSHHITHVNTIPKNVIPISLLV